VAAAGKGNGEAESEEAAAGERKLGAFGGKRTCFSRGCADGGHGGTTLGRLSLAQQGFT
jgi:hypothetical protein